MEVRKEGKERTWRKDGEEEWEERRMGGRDLTTAFHQLSLSLLSHQCVPSSVHINYISLLGPIPFLFSMFAFQLIIFVSFSSFSPSVSLLISSL